MRTRNIRHERRDNRREVFYSGVGGVMESSGETDSDHML